MTFYFKNTKKDIIITQEVKEDFENKICLLREKKIEPNKIRDHCHLTGKCRGPAHSKCNNNVKQSQINFISVMLHKFSNYDCHLFFKKLIHRKKYKVKFKNLPKTNKEYLSVTYGCIKFDDGYGFLSSSLDKLDETLVDNSHKSPKNLKKKFVGNDNILDIANEKKILGKDEINRTIEDLKKDYSDKTNELEEALTDYIGENDLKILTTDFLDKWKYLTNKLAYPY